jgi:hypothetical protein
MASGPKPSRSTGPPMTLGNMRALGVQNLIAYCLNDACRHQALIDVSSYRDAVDARPFEGVELASAALVGALVLALMK